jgi:cytochrome c-type biogenesis protein
MNFFLNLWVSLLAGLFAPLGAVCVLPLYPGFLAYLANKVSTKRSIKGSSRDTQRRIILFGIIVTLGVISAMFLFGLIFTLFLQASLTKAIGIISPIAFSILALVSIFLIFNVDIGRFFPKASAPVLKNPYLSSFIFGLFFGAIVLPCNPASLIVLFAVSTSTISFLTNFLNFLVFGFGMALPLLVLAVISASSSKNVIGWLTKNKRAINLVAGIIMLLVSLYYLI